MESEKYEHLHLSIYVFGIVCFGSCQGIDHSAHDTAAQDAFGCFL